MNIIAYLDTFVLPPNSLDGGMMGEPFDWNKKLQNFLPMVMR